LQKIFRWHYKDNWQLFREIIGVGCDSRGGYLNVKVGGTGM